MVYFLNFFTFSNITLPQDVLSEVRNLPSGDRAIDWLDQQILLLLTQKSCVFTCRNRGLPVYTLPSEILSCIFRLSSAEFEHHLYPHPGMYSFTHVCKWWRDVALSDPAIWAQYIRLNAPRMAMEFIFRSRDVPGERAIAWKRQRCGRNDTLRRVRWMHPWASPACYDAAEGAGQAVGGFCTSRART